MNQFSKCIAVSACSILLTGGAFAQQQLETAPVPPKPQPGESVEVKRQSGIGSEFAFAEAGVVEIGGSLGFTQAEEYSDGNFSPSIGYFFANNVQISLLGNVGYVKVDGEDAKSVGSLIAEPSFHYPTTNTTFLFAGFGVGALFESQEKTGVALAPRVGYKNLVGRSGMFTISLQPIIGLNESEAQSVQGTVLNVRRANNLRLGYTVLL